MGMSEAQKMTGNQPGSGSKSEVNKKSKDKSCESQKDKILRKEEKVLKALEDENLKIERFYVQLDSGTKIWTWKIKNSDSVNQLLPPIVLIHGMAGAAGIYIYNFKALSSKRSVYSIDLPGFGLSDRNKLGKNPTQVENNWTDSIDQWRQKMSLDKIILIGHSMGGYLAAVYLMRYSQERFSRHVNFQTFLDKNSQEYGTTVK